MVTLDNVDANASMSADEFTNENADVNTLELDIYETVTDAFEHM